MSRRQPVGMSLLETLPTAAATLALGLLAGGCGSSASGSSTGASTSTASTATASASAGGPVDATLGEWSVAVSDARAKAGKVTFAVKNAGKIKHEFVVLRTTGSASSLGSGSRVSERGNVGETGDIAPGASKSVTIDLKPGHYSLVCNLPDHYKLGMHADFTVD